MHLDREAQFGTPVPREPSWRQTVGRSTRWVRRSRRRCGRSRRRSRTSRPRTSGTKVSSTTSSATPRPRITATTNTVRAAVTTPSNTRITSTTHTMASATSRTTAIGTGTTKDQVQREPRTGRSVARIVAPLDDALEAAVSSSPERVTIRRGAAGRGGLAETDRGNDGVRLRVNAELGQDVLGVCAQRVPRHPKFLGDLVGGVAVGHRLQDLKLSRREAFDAALEVAVAVRSRALLPEHPVHLGRFVQRLTLEGAAYRRRDVLDGGGLRQHPARAG